MESQLIDKYLCNTPFINIKDIDTHDHEPLHFFSSFAYNSKVICVGYIVFDSRYSTGSLYLASTIMQNIRNFQWQSYEKMDTQKQISALIPLNPRIK